jgi:hypothetical protein
MCWRSRSSVKGQPGERERPSTRVVHRLPTGSESFSAAGGSAKVERPSITAAAHFLQSDCGRCHWPAPRRMGNDIRARPSCQEKPGLPSGGHSDGVGTGAGPATSSRLAPSQGWIAPSHRRRGWCLPCRTIATKPCRHTHPRFHRD